MSKGSKKKKPYKIKTKRLILRALDNDELEKRRYEQMDFQRQKAYSDMLAGCEAEPKDRLWHTAWEVTLKESGEYVGDVFFKGKPVDDEAEIAYFLSEKFKDSENAADAVNQLAEWGFATEAELYFVCVWTDSESDVFTKTLDDGNFTVVEETESMLRFEIVRTETAWLPIGMCLGVGMGTSIGLILDNLALGSGIGISLGVALGLLVDAGNRKKREKILREHRGEKFEDDEH